MLIPSFSSASPVLRSFRKKSPIVPDEAKHEGGYASEIEEYFRTILESGRLQATSIPHSEK